MTQPPGYAADPVLVMLWTTVPAFTGATGSAPAGKPNDAAPPAAEPVPIVVNLATVQGAESSMLSSTAVIVNAYNAENQAVQAEIAANTIFGQQAQYRAYVESNSASVHEVVPGSWQNLPDTGLQQAAQEFAAQINPAMTQVLRMIADATEAVGVYIALLNNAGQAYSAADIHSALPPMARQLATGG